MFEYSVEMLPADLNIATAKKSLEDLINSYASKGWELVQIGPVAVAQHPGCLAGLFGAGKRYGSLTAVVFKIQNATIKARS